MSNMGSVGADIMVEGGAAAFNGKMFDDDLYAVVNQLITTNAAEEKFKSWSLPIVSSYLTPERMVRARPVYLYKQTCGYIAVFLMIECKIDRNLIIAMAMLAS